MAKAKTKAKKSDKGKTAGKGASKGWLRERTFRRTERRFAPKQGVAALVGVILTSLGALAAGAGVYGQLLRAAGPHPYATYLLAGGLVLFVAGLVTGGGTLLALRVGDAGLATERDGQVVERLGWFEIDAVRFTSGTLIFSGAGKIVSIRLAEHPDAAALAVAEGLARVPDKMTDAPQDLPPPAPEASTVVVLEPPQLAGLRCAASGRLISFEGDARVCGRCGQAFHKEDVPKSCTACDAELA